MRALRFRLGIWNWPAALSITILGAAVGLSTGVSCQVPEIPDELIETSFRGSAVVLRATVLGQTASAVDTGQLSAGGGALEASASDINVAGLLTADVAHASVVGGDQAARSEASLHDIELTVAGQRITADFLIARAAAKCDNISPTVAGDFQIVNLRINGVLMNTTLEANQSLELRNPDDQLLGRIVLNEQIENVDGLNGDITVSGMHIEVPNVADIVLFQAKAGISCALPRPKLDYVTGGGWITSTPSGSKGLFAVSGGIVNGGFHGHLNYLDRDADIKVRADSITRYEVLHETGRRIAGAAIINGQSGFTFEVDVADNGEPGTADVFIIRLSNGYEAGGTLRGGNIQLHGS